MGETIPVALTHHRYRQLDSLRGLAALTVFFGHYIGLIGFTVKSPSLFYALARTPLGALINGEAAVIFFFVLSGFVLSLPFVGNGKPLKLTAFYVKRIFRIYPAFIFAIIFSILLKEYLFDKTGMTSFSAWIKDFWIWGWNTETVKETLKTLLLIGPKFNFNLIDPPIWSLIIEMKMSIILPFFIMIVSRGGAVLNISFLFVIAWLTYSTNAWEISVFYSGILMAKYRDYLIHNIRQWGTILLIAAILLAIFLYNNNFEFFKQLQHLNPIFNNTWSKYLIAGGCCIMIMIVLAREKATRFFEHHAFTFMGDISYSFYLIHAPLMLTIGSIITIAFTFSPVYIFLASFVLTVALSYLMCIFIERPFIKVAAGLVMRYNALNGVAL